MSVKLSVVIVNYNVKYFIEQCLFSVFNAKEQFELKYGSQSVEIFVVDNNSHDLSCELIKNKFPEVRLTENKKNIGFSGANNQAIKLSKGEYVLLLNPDTIVGEDSFLKIIEFMDDHKDAGGLGVKMMNGSGEFLPESKRSLPTPLVSFFKIFGFSKLFPKSKKFGKYHLTYMPEDQVNEVEVLSGAFMLLRVKALEKAGLPDETFFMYGEDIDLSYRILKAGFKNFYFPETEIIHYKGESTKKGSLNYVFMFYNAMIIFAKKHFSKKNAGLFSFIIKTAIWARAGMSFGKRLFKTLFLPALDSVLFFLGFYLIKPLWETYKFKSEGYYPEEYLLYAVPSYILVWLLVIYLSKGYKRPPESKNLFKGILSGTFIILIIYSLLNEAYRYSRALLLLGSAWAMITSWLIRAFFYVIGLKEFAFKSKPKKNITILAEKEEVNKIKEIILKSVDINNEQIKFIDFRFNEKLQHDIIKKFIVDHQINEVIISHKNFKSVEIINILKHIKIGNVEFKTYVPGSLAVIGSNSINSAGEIYVTDLNRITKPENIRIKRLSDIFFSLLFLLLFPLIILLIDNKRNVMRNIFLVLRGKLSWVGYIPDNEPDKTRLPNIKKGILHPVTYRSFDKQEIYRINAQYASNYNLTDDIYIIYRAFSKIGNKNL